MPSGPRGKALAFLRPMFGRWLARDPLERPSAAELAAELAEIRRGRAGGRRSFAPPRGLRGVLVALAMGTLLMTSALIADSPARPIEVVQGAVVAPASNGPGPMNEAQAVRLIRTRLETEEQRALELEEELTRVRRSALGLSDGRRRD